MTARAEGRAPATCRRRRGGGGHQPLVTLECLVGPLRDENLGLHDHYLRALDQFRRLPLTEEQFIRAAGLRARHMLKTPDALHLAAAQTHGCDELWTNDGRLSAASHGLAVDVVGV